jgi:hypothetical protein
MTRKAMKPIDVSALLLGNMERVFNERDGAARAAALAELWSEDAMMYESDEILVGREAISAGVERIHAKLPGNTRFSPIGQAIENHGTALLRWEAGAPSYPAIVSGVDVAKIVDGRIQNLHVYLERRPS